MMFCVLGLIITSISQAIMRFCMLVIDLFLQCCHNDILHLMQKHDTSPCRITDILWCDLLFSGQTPRPPVSEYRV